MKGLLNPFNFVQFFVLLFIFVESGQTLKCYICDSTNNPSCVDLPSGSGLVGETCNVKIMSSNVGSWLKDIVTMTYHDKGKELPVPMVCQKIIATNDKNEQITYRGCQLDQSKPDSCDAGIRKAKDQRGIKIDHCSTCDKDLCNTGALNVPVCSQFTHVLLLFGFIVFSRLLL